MDWHSEEFDTVLEKDQDTLIEFVMALLTKNADNYDLSYKKRVYISEELASDFGNRVIQVIRKGIP